ncbi:reverse transcriptase SR3-right [Elysia marginata]|uniref:Reverse transcriptase SR3-right n=1 Tax=Elysia marginata TaxID=1093978 RepID=A0AAV4FIQ1_9GAST|nr:reverse transcriptase SR3-right [Elysia marginata]
MDRRESPRCLEKGILIKLPKNGDLSQCYNWRGINLLSVSGKIFCRVILYQIKSSVDKAPREEQAGFREGRSCVDQVFILRTIIEQSIEWNSSTYIISLILKRLLTACIKKLYGKYSNFQAYGIPQKIINNLSDKYANNQCCVRHGGQQSDWFAVKSGVQQGCIIPPLIFLNAIDWVMKRATNQQLRGITWKAFNQLEEEDLAGDIALFSYYPTHKKTCRRKQVAWKQQQESLQVQSHENQYKIQ